MSLFRNENESAFVDGRKHFTDVIKNSGSGDLLIWRQPEEDFNTSSTLVVMPGEKAVFVKDGEIQEVFDSGTYRLSTQNYPFISRLRNMLSGGISVFNCVVYFVRTTTSTEIPWGTTTPIQVRDKLLGIATEIRSRGTYRISVIDPELLLRELVGNNVTALEADNIMRTFALQFQGIIKTLLTSALNDLDGELLGIEAQMDELAQSIAPHIADSLREYGLELRAFAIVSLDIAADELRRRYDEAGINAIAKLRDALGEKAVLETLGDDWTRVQSFSVMRTLADNPGSGGNAADLASLAVGIAAAAPLASMAQETFGSVEPSPIANNPIETLDTLKALLDRGLISESDYNDKKAEVLARL